MDRKNTGYLDILRISAALTVVLLHVITASRFHYDAAIPLATAAVLSALRPMLNWSVPAFLMITGYLFLGIKKECDYPHIKKYVLRFLGALFTIGFAYAVMERVYWQGAVNLSVLLGALGDVLTGNLWEHMWYVYEILGIYLILPILRPFCEKGPRHLAWGCGVSFLLTLLLPFAGEVLGLEGGISSKVPFVRYIFYLFAGGLFAARQPEKKGSNIALAAVLTAVSGVLLPVFSGLGLNCGFLSLPAAGMTLGVFRLTQTLLSGRGGTAWQRRLSGATWGIYLIHPLFLNVLLKVLEWNPLDGPAAVTIPTTTAAVFLLSWLATEMLRKLPVMKKIL